MIASKIDVIMVFYSFLCKFSAAPLYLILYLCSYFYVQLALF